ncbi:MAG: prephenate dehydrogenase/arogenate dehydrogenase family protein [Nitrospira sp.]|nr:prephenate dehydrogenase/arogenate dehydrogenase family protein [bacterium]MBL7050316.1 prephenate dehydrogenase/arogenate dehydrogenase family protein [Nitrospira sp.]
MNFNKIAIIGVGLIGGSFALAMRKNGFKGTITGVGRNLANLQKAREIGMIDEYTTSPAEGVTDADLVQLASPVGQFPKIMREIGNNLRPGCIVTDVGSIKSEVIKMLEPLMPQGTTFVGAHPIAGRECSGIDCATPDLFEDARCIITPGKQTDLHAIETVAAMWEKLGSTIIEMSPEDHDQTFAAVSHMPHIVAYTLVNTIDGMDKDNMLKLGGKGLKDMTRIALSSPGLWSDICSYNRDAILHSLKAFSAEISRASDAVESSDWEGLKNIFENANRARNIIEQD